MKWMSVCSETASRTPTCAEVPRNISTWPLLQSIQKRHCWVARYSDIQNFPFRSWWVPGCIMLSPSTWGGAARERVYDDVPILQKYPDTVFISSLEVTAPFIDWNAHETSAELYKMSVLSNVCNTRRVFWSTRSINRVECGRTYSKVSTCARSWVVDLMREGAKNST